MVALQRLLCLSAFSMDIEEADLLCPPVPREGGDAICQPDPSPGGPANFDDRKGRKASIPASSTRGFGALQTSLSSLASQWVYAIGPSRLSGPRGYHTPIPFDQTVFATLDSKISFDFELDELGQTVRKTRPVPASDADSELRHEPDHAIRHAMASKVVISHHPLRQWEDIPPSQRSRGYNDQPAYTDEFDDFLWLPRDPLSTLDLDDTVEMRLSLTTSAGGSGAIGDWPPLSDLASVKSRHGEENWQEVFLQRSAASPVTVEHVSPGAASQRRLIDRIDLPEQIGSEVEEGLGSGLLRRTTRKASEGFSQFLRRSRSGNQQSDAVISMRTLSITSSSTPEPILSPAVPPVAPQRSPSNDPSFLTRIRISTPHSAPNHPHHHVFESDYASPQAKSASQLSYAPQLDRSTSSCGPSGMRLSSQNSDAGFRSPSKSRERSSSALSAHRSVTRVRSAGALSPAQQALVEEVMEEERLAARAVRKEEKEERYKEDEEVGKEQDRLRRSSGFLEAQKRSASEAGAERVARPGSSRSGSASDPASA